MIFKLSLRYYLLNQKRTVKGSQIVAIGFIAIFSTNLLIGGFTSEITTITSKLNKSDISYQIQPINSEFFSDDQIFLLEQLHREERGLDYLNFEHLGMAEFSSPDFSNVEIPIHLTNMSALLEKIGMKADPNLTNSTQMFATSDIQSPLGLVKGRIYNLKSALINSSLSLVDLINPSHATINSGIYIDAELFENLTFNRAYLEFLPTTNIPRLIEKVQLVGGVDVQLIRGEDEFLKLSANNISNTLLILQIAISFLVFLSIFNLMNIIILESRYDIRVLLSVGFSRYSVWILFVTIGTIIGLIGAIFTLIISLVVISAILSLLSAVGLPFVSLTVGSSEILLLFANTVLVTFLSSLIPSYQGVKSLG